MPSCAACPNKQAILNPGGLCRGCFALEEANDPLKDMDLSKPLKNANLGELVDIFKAMMKPVELKLEQIKQSTAAQDAKITLLEANLKEKDTTIATMSEIIINMQSSLNRIDSSTRNTNIIVSGLQEQDIVNEQDGQLTEEKEKIKRLLEVMEVEADVLANVDAFECSRIGQIKENATRLVKVNVGSKVTRDLILQKAPSLKHKNELWGRVYVKKDVHPVYSKETSRIYRKMKSLKEKNPTKEVKIVDGKLTVDGRTVDKNMFFH